MHFYLILRKDFRVGLHKETVFASELLFCLEFKSWFKNTDFPKNFLVSFSLSVLEIPQKSPVIIFHGFGDEILKEFLRDFGYAQKEIGKLSLLSLALMRDDSCLGDTAFAPAHPAPTGTPAPSPAVSFPSCSSPLLPLPPAELGFQYLACSPLKMCFNLSWQLLSVAWREIFKNLTNNRFQLLTSAVLRNYIISLILAIQ